MRLEEADELTVHRKSDPAVHAKLPFQTVLLLLASLKELAEVDGYHASKLSIVGLARRKEVEV